MELELLSTVKLGWGYYAREFCLLGLVIASIITIFLFIVNNKQCQSCIDENRKEQLHKRRNRFCLVGLSIIIFLFLVIMMLTLALPRYSIY